MKPAFFANTYTIPAATLLTLLLIACHPSAHLSKTDCIAMRNEADSFLTHMPEGLQQRQTAAILQAIGGDNTALESVRHARNASPEISPNVNMRMLSPTLRLYEPAGSDEGRQKPLPLLIYLHGGGWTIGSLNSCGHFCDCMAATGRMKVLAADYRLAPEHPFPQGLSDCTAAVAYAREHAEALGIDTTQVSVGGDSSGGNLAIATALAPECRGRIAALLLFYPVTKAFPDGSSSWNAYGNGYGLDADIMEAFNASYLVGGADVRDHRISPGLAPDSLLRQLPPTLLIAAGRDILRDQGKAFARQLPRQVRRIEFPGAVHLFITVAGQPTAFGHAVRLATEFIETRKKL